MSDTPTIREMHGLSDKPRTFDQVAITVADPDTIRSWSFGEVVNPETINYRTFKPEKGGLFCERIFGPTRDMECACGKYKRIKHKGITCDRCGVEVTNARVRRERMGHIELAVPVSHIWFYKCMPSRIGLMLDMTARHLERVIYYEDYIVVDPGSTPLEKGAILTEEEFRNAEDEYGYDSFEAGMGAEAIQKMLAAIDLPTLVADLQEQLDNTNSKQNKRKIAKRLKLAQGFLQSNTRPEWMILNVLPVIPPDLRPLVPLEGGRFATSDLNDLYRRVINRNNRLKTLLSLKTPEVIIRNEKRMLQEAVDALFDNGRHGRAVTGAGNRPLKSLSDMLKGKGGRFRQNLLGKRVDYSGRSVIVIGPELKLNQCGLPKKMALILFEPFIIHRLKELGYVHTVRSAKKLIDRKTPEVWDILEEVTKGHPVMLNRAPTLHRLSIQAFEPVLIEGSAIRLHPLVCNAYNADFDGDQMAVHVPLSVEAQMEARQLMLAPNNIFSPASGKPIATPTQDIILGAYFLTHTRAAEVQNNQDNHHHLPLFESIDEVEYAIAARKIGYHDWIRLHNPDYGKKPSEVVYGDVTKKVIITTAGRVRFNEIWPRELGYINRNVGKKQMGDIIWRCYQTVGKERTVQTLDALKNLGFKEATRSGCSIGIVDMVVPSQKKTEIEKAYAELDKVTRQYKNGIITDGERYQKVVDIWTQTTDVIQAALYRKLEHNEGSKMASPLFMMVDSGARGNKAQIKQLSGMRGLMAKPSGEIIERPITANFREGLSVLEYFISTHGARKGLADTALKTADSGYMTRKLVDVAQDVIVHAEDCGTSNGITVHAIYDGDEEVASLASRIYGRTSCERIVDPVSGEVIVDINDLINEKQAEQLEKIGIERLKIRSVLTCELKKGCCAKCYGLNLATGQEVKIGEAVGIIAAQSIGEPGTQLTMRTIHSGGVAGVDDITQGLPTVSRMFDIVGNVNEKILGREAELAPYSGHLSIKPEKSEYVLTLTDSEDHTRVLDERRVPASVRFMPEIEDGCEVRAGDQITKGFVNFRNLRKLTDIESTMHTFVESVKDVYTSQGVDLNDKHIEVLARQMLRRVQITNPGDSKYLLGQYVDRYEFADEVERVARLGGQAPVAEPVILGTLKVASNIDSWLSSASFIRTAGVLTEAAIEGKVDHLLDLKSNVIVGKKIPAGTGLKPYANAKLTYRTADGYVDIDGPASPNAKSLPEWAPVELKDLDEQLPQQLDWAGYDEFGGADGSFTRNGHTISAEKARLYLFDDLGVSQRWTNKFSEVGIETVGDLVGKSEEDLLRIDGIGAKAIEELRDGLEAHDLLYILENNDDVADEEDLSQLLQMVFSPDGPDDILLGTSATPTHHADADEELLGAPIDDKKAPANGAINEDMASLDELLNQLVDTDDAEEAKDNDEE